MIAIIVLIIASLVIAGVCIFTIVKTERNKVLYRKGFNVGDVFTYKHEAINPFGPTLCYLITDKKTAENGDVYYKFVKCNPSGVVESSYEYTKHELSMGSKVKIASV